ncbi:MAG: holo-ACP synthase [Kiritimatiellae bacterium]|nr:holo-ACP synthase [Kiritimatiellia bacterium]
MKGAVLGTGIDLVENARMQDMLERWGDRLKQRVFLPVECSYCDGKASPWRHYAGRFAVKEAVAKAFGTGIEPRLSWLDIAVGRDAQSGAPFVELSERGRRLAEALGVGRILVSLSHTHHYAVAQALLLGDERNPGQPA